MKVIRRKRHGAEILRLVGPLTAGTGVGALRRLEPDLLDGPDRNMVLDLSEVGYVDAAGIGELLRLHRRVTALGNTLVLAGLPERVREVLRITRLTGDLDLATDLRDALARLSLPARSAPRHPSWRADRASAQTHNIPITVAS